jgi:TolB-like protein/cytochrome c-type biogenesis protein CcmH/NrfG
MEGPVGERAPLLHELKRRGVIHVAGLYIVAAWVIVQVADVVSQGPFPMPPEALRLIWVALILIFPIALIFGWRYDITRDGILRTDPLAGENEDLPLRPVDHGIIAGLSLLVTGILGFTTLEITEAIEHDRLRAGIGVEVMDEPAPPNSIAVLPFKACASQFVDEALAAGLATEVINQLATRRSLKVIARSSSFTMAGFGLPLRKIAVPLGVKYLLTGEVCRDGDVLTLTVELVHEDGFVVWSESYKQAVNPSGELSVSLAVLVADGVSIALGHNLAVQHHEPVNRLAYEQLVIGREHAGRNDIDRAREAFEKALKYQPDFAEAIFALALLESDIGTHMKVGTSIEQAWPLGEQALTMARRQLEQGQADFRTHFVAGRILHTLARWDRKLIWRQAGELDPVELETRKKAADARMAEAEGHVRKAIALNPSDIGIYRLLASNLDRQGLERRGEALEILESGLARDPFNANLNSDVAKRWAARGRYRQAMELLERFEALPDPSATWWSRLEIMKTQAYWDEKAQLLIDILLRQPEAFEGAAIYGHLLWLPSELAVLGLREEAQAWYAQVKEIPKQGWGAVLREWFLEDYMLAMGQGDQVIEADMARINAMTDEEILDAQFGEADGMVWTLAQAGEYERAIRLRESIQHSHSWGPFWSERQVGPRLELAALYQKVGRDADAERLLGQLTDYLETEYDTGIKHPATLYYLAETYARLGRDDKALDMLRKAVDYHLRLTEADEHYMIHSPWKRMEDDPRYIAQLERMRADLDQQAERIRTMLAQYDVNELVAPVMALAQEAHAETQ